MSCSAVRKGHRNIVRALLPELPRKEEEDPLIKLLDKFKGINPRIINESIAMRRQEKERRSTSRGSNSESRGSMSGALGSARESLSRSGRMGEPTDSDGRVVLQLGPEDEEKRSALMEEKKLLEEWVGNLPFAGSVKMLPPEWRQIALANGKGRQPLDLVWDDVSVAELLFGKSSFFFLHSHSFS